MMLSKCWPEPRMCLKRSLASGSRLVRLPLYHDLQEDQQQRVIAQIVKYFD